MASKKSKKIRADFRKGHQGRRRKGDLTRDFGKGGDPDQFDALASGERVSGKGDLTRKRTLRGAELDDDDALGGVRLEVDESVCRPGRVLSVHGLVSHVQPADNAEPTDAAAPRAVYRCAVRQLLKSISTDQRHVVAVGDRVMFRPVGEDEGMIERVEPRRGLLSRTVRGRQQVIVANVDRLLIVGSAAEPDLKPGLIDRMLVTAEAAGIEPIICINKIDLVDPAKLQPLVGVYGQLGYWVLLLSAQRGDGVAELRRLVAGRESVVAGQSGVGKSSLLNAIEPGLELKVGRISEENQKGRHTTTAARLIPLGGADARPGGYIVDTPGVRTFQLWDVIPEEVSGYFRELRPWENRCRFPNCTHTHEDDCAVKEAAAYGQIDLRRYESYCQMVAGDG